MPILLGLVLASALGGGGFWAAYQGLLPFGPAEEETESTPVGDGGGAAQADETVEFVPLPPMVVSLGSPGRGRHLKFRAEVEVAPGRGGAVSAIMPRIQDTVNGYLRAIPLVELEEPAALVLLRAQLLRRLQLVAPQGSVRDLLIMEFVLD